MLVFLLGRTGWKWEAFVGRTKNFVERVSWSDDVSRFTFFFFQDPPYRNNERGRSMGVGPMRSRPMEKRHDTSPYSGVPYLSPPPPDTWRRTNSDSALHQSANEACQSTTTIPHRRGTHSNLFSFFTIQIYYYFSTITLSSRRRKIRVCLLGNRMFFVFELRIRRRNLWKRLFWNNLWFYD